MKIVICLLLLLSKSSSGRNKNLSIFVNIKFEGVVCCLHMMSCVGKRKKGSVAAAAGPKCSKFNVIYLILYLHIFDSSVVAKTMQSLNFTFCCSGFIVGS